MGQFLLELEESIVKTAIHFLIHTDYLDKLLSFGILRHSLV